MCVRACVCVLNFYFAYLSLRHRTIFYIGTLLILMACVCVCVCVCACMRTRAGVCMCVCAQVCVCAFGCCFVSANGLLVDVCQCCCLLMFVCLPLSRHFPCCKTWWIKNLNLSLKHKVTTAVETRVLPIEAKGILPMMLIIVPYIYWHARWELA